MTIRKVIVMIYLTEKKKYTVSPRGKNYHLKENRMEEGKGAEKQKDFGK